MPSMIMAEILAFEDPNESEADCVLYRHFDAAGVLLYIGISGVPFLRLQQHKSASAWFKQITTITIQRFPNRIEAARAERAAIESEKPLFNGRPGPKPLPPGERREVLPVRLPSALIARAKACGKPGDVVEKALIYWLDHWEGRAHEILARRDE